MYVYICSKPLIPTVPVFLLYNQSIVVRVLLIKQYIDFGFNNILCFSIFFFFTPISATLPGSVRQASARRKTTNSSGITQYSGFSNVKAAH